MMKMIKPRIYLKRKFKDHFQDLKNRQINRQTRNFQTLILYQYIVSILNKTIRIEMLISYK